MTFLNRRTIYFNVLFWVMVLFSGCLGIKEFDRMPEVSDSEKESLTCEEIEEEIDTVYFFIQKTYQYDHETRGQEVLNVPFNMCMGDRLNFNLALKSGWARLNDLNEMKKERGCSP